MTNPKEISILVNCIKLFKDLRWIYHTETNIRIPNAYKLRLK